MTVEKKNPNATDVAATSNVHTAINDRDNASETAAFGTDLTLTFTSTSYTATSAEFWGGVAITLADGSPTPSGARTLTVPGSEERGLFLIDNGTADEVTVTISGQSLTAPSVPSGARGFLRCDGSNVETVVIIGSGITTFVESSQSAFDAKSPAIDGVVTFITS